jgi:GT2 family glycosyltransferase
MARKPATGGREKAVRAPEIAGFMDRIDEAGCGGWVVDFAAPGEPLRLRVLIDGMIAEVISCDLKRDDVAALKLPSDRIGFYYNIPPRFWNGLRHVLTFATVAGAPVVFSTRTGVVMEEMHFCLNRPVRFDGLMDGSIDGLVQGWAVAVDDKAKTKRGGVKILVTCEGQPVAELLADQYRADVADAVGCDPNCGFSFAPPPELANGARTAYRFFAMPGRVELRGSPVEVFNFEGRERTQMQALIARADELFSFAYHLRRELKAAMPAERYFLNDYARWVAKSRPLMQERARLRYGALPEILPLVSVICPVFRPAIGDFLQAVDSVRAQSYEHWELLLVDDGGKDILLTQTMMALAAADSRIKLLPQAKNGGIAKATNSGLAAAAGAFIAFFDHDDVLEPTALDIMLRAQRATGARLLYSDEDKVERSGGFCEPHLKPDFNYRFLLEVNYICHFVLADAGLVRETGFLDARYDGAQDHDFLLRMVERLTPAEIHHVPEILYHWRKSAGSTAAAGTGAKPKAALAGKQAVAAHLQRRGLPAEVHRRENLTCYRVEWRPAAAAKAAGRVSILIPFRDHVDLTRECVNAIRKYTKDVQYEILLLDNWSVSAEAEAFCAEQANLPATRVIRIAEAFNYSRINNIGARAAEYEFLLFCNNDVIVKDELWLRRMVNECLVNESVGAVGAKLLYPDGSVQHGGVVLGVGGVADHAFRGIMGNAPGYVMRAMAAQQISAVTAACMLVRKAAFDQAGGFDETELTIAFNDIDLCVKLQLAGWQIIFVPDVMAEHRESQSRGDDFDEAKLARFMRENEVMRQRYPDILPADPFYSPHFSREGGMYRELRLWEPTPFARP